MNSNVMDWKFLLFSENEEFDGRDGILIEKNDDREIFKRDFDQICFWSSFRRLQDKAQVFPLDENDFSRTRLTHSIEVMSVAEALGEKMINIIIKSELDKKEDLAKEKTKEEKVKEKKHFLENPQLWMDKDLYRKIKNIPIILRSAALIHDLGNPPFGHISEQTISQWFKENLCKFKFIKKTSEIVKEVVEVHGNKSDEYCYLDGLLGPEICHDFEFFDGNAELLRIVRRLQNISPNRLDYPVNLSLPLMATTIKYPDGFLKKRFPNDPKKWNKKNYFTSEKEYYSKIEENLTLFDNRHPLAFLLEAADDAAYIASDLEDAMAKGLIKIEDVLRITKISNVREVKWLLDMDIIGQDDLKEFTNAFNTGNKTTEVSKAIESFIKSESNNVAIKKAASRIRGFFISKIKNEMEKMYPAIMEGQYYENLLETSSGYFLSKVIRKMLEVNVYYSKPIIEKKIEGINAINKMLDVFVPAVINSFGKKLTDSIDCINSRLISNNFMELCEARIRKTQGTKEKIYEMLFVVVDFISGMTDSFASKTFKTLK